MARVLLTDEQVDKIIVEELWETIQLLLTDLDRDEGGFYMDPDYELIRACRCVLKYYTPPDEYQRIVKRVHELVKQADQMLNTKPN